MLILKDFGFTISVDYLCLKKITHKVKNKTK